MLEIDKNCMKLIDKLVLIGELEMIWKIEK